VIRNGNVYENTQTGIDSSQDERRTTVRQCEFNIFTMYIVAGLCWSTVYLEELLPHADRHLLRPFLSIHPTRKPGSYSSHADAIVFAQVIC